jgi:hypothetical protein
MALRLQEVEPRGYQFCVTPTGRELPPMTEHWKRLECLLGQPLVRVPAPTLLDLIKKYRALPNWRMRWCTRQVKIEPFQQHALANLPATCYVGIRADEVAEREGSDHTGLDGVQQDFPLVRRGWSLSHVKDYLRRLNIVIPPRGDCDWCFFQQLAEWWRLWHDWPEQWMEGEAVEEWTGHTFRSDKRDTWPASMKGLREMFEKGFVPKGADQTHLPFDIAERPAMCAWCAR